MLVSPEKRIIPCSFVLVKLCANNIAEYQAHILGLQITIEMGIKYLYDDSQLVINQLL